MGKDVQPNQATTVQAWDPRVRVSFIAFSQPLTWNSAVRSGKTTRTKGTPFDKFNLLDPDQLVELHKCGVDDLTLGWVIQFNPKNPATVIPTKWDKLDRATASDSEYVKRLSFLGYYFGPVPGVDEDPKDPLDQNAKNEGIKAGLTWFQEEEGIKTTGELDDATKDAIQKRGSQFLLAGAVPTKKGDPDPRFVRSNYYKPKKGPAYYPPKRDNTQYRVDKDWKASLAWSVTFLEPEAYMKQLVEACRSVEPRVQVLIGYIAGQDDHECLNFLEWASDLQVDHHAQEIAHKVDELDADGVNFDIEIEGLSARHAHNVERLIRTTAVFLADKNKIVAYDGAPFKEGGEDGAFPGNAGPESQRYAACRGLTNIIARPQCYGSKNKYDTGKGAGDKIFIDEAWLEASTKVALDNEKGGGITREQLQYVIPAGDCPRFCKEPLEKQKVGIVLYALLPTPSAVYDTAEQCDLILNGPYAAKPGTPGTPDQVPHK
jgi:hypothetical protein